MMMVMKTSLLLLLLALVTQPSLTVEGQEGDQWVDPEMEKTVYTMGTDNFDELVSSKAKWIIKFYSPVSFTWKI